MTSGSILRAKTAPPTLRTKTAPPTLRTKTAPPALRAAAALLALGVVVAGTAPGWAQTAGQALQQAVPRDPDPDRAALPPLAVPAGPSITGDPGLRLTLTEVSVDGATAYDDAALSRFWADSLGREISVADVAAIAEAVQVFYRGEGYVFTRVLAAVPDLAAGQVVLRVVEAQVKRVTIEEPAGSVGPVRALLERLAAPLVGLRNPRLADLERVLLLMNDVPGVTRATAVPQAGEGGPGALALSINVERTPVSGAVFADNRNQPAFGPGNLGVLVDLDGWSSAGDSTRLIQTISFGDQFEDLEKRLITQVQHQRHLGGSGLTLGLRALYGKSRPGDNLATANLDGVDLEAGFSLRYPLLRTRARSVWLHGGFEALDNDLDISTGGVKVTSDRRRVLMLGAEALLRDGRGYTALSFDLRQGLDAFGASQKGDRFLSRADGDPAATVISATLEREHAVNDDWSVYVAAGGQYAFAPLLGGEEFALGGATYGRGYDPSERLGDHGIGAKTELRWRRTFQMTAEPIALVLYGFGDAGRVWTDAPGGEATSLTSYGAGARLLLPRDVFVEAELAKPVRDLIRTDDNPRFFLTAQKRF